MVRFMPQRQKRRRPVPKQQQQQHQRRLWIIATCSVAAASLLVRPVYFTFHTSLFAFERNDHVPEYLLVTRPSESDENKGRWSPEIAQSIIDQALAFMGAPTLHNASRIDNDYQAANDDSVVPLLPPAEMMVTDHARLLQVVDDLDDRDIDEVNCGTYKCFFPSLNDNTTGWLLAPNLPYQVARIRGRPAASLADAPDPPRTIWHGMWFGWNLSRKLTNTSWAIRHFYLDAPLLLSFSSSVNDGTEEKDAAQRLAQKINFIFEYDYPNGTESKTVNRFFEALSAESLLDSTLGGAVAQRVQRAPGHIKVIKKNNEFHKVHKLVRTTGYYRDRPVTPEFLRRILRALDELAKVLESYPSLWHDFQFATDRYSGHVYHVDLDRSFEMFQCFRPKAVAYQHFLHRQLPLMRCFLYRCAMEIIETVMEFTNLTTVEMGMEVDPNPMKCNYRDGRPP